MKIQRIVVSGFVVLAALALAQTVSFSADENQSGQSNQANQGNPPPQIAFDITKADVDTLLKNAPPAVDQPLRVVDMGKYNMEVAVIHRGATKPGEVQSGPYHDETAETYIIISGSGTLATGGTIMNKKVSTNYNIMNGPGGNGQVGPGAIIRKLNVGDICIIPPGVLHVWTEIPDHVDYLSVRPDPDRVLPAGYVSPLMMKSPTQEVKPAQNRQ